MIKNYENKEVEYMESKDWETFNSNKRYMEVGIKEKEGKRYIEVSTKGESLGLDGKEWGNKFKEYVKNSLGMKGLNIISKSEENKMSERLYEEDAWVWEEYVKAVNKFEEELNKEVA